MNEKVIADQPRKVFGIISLMEMFAISSTFWFCRELARGFSSEIVDIIFLCLGSAIIVLGYIFGLIAASRAEFFRSAHLAATALFLPLAVAVQYFWNNIWVTSLVAIAGICYICLKSRGYLFTRPVVPETAEVN
ncbi:MAG: hypothetical protein Q4C71_04105 [Microbacteriaceae bacterium]|nr:hypothetical protein [Microbacteriaceae bacterium]